MELVRREIEDGVWNAEKKQFKQAFFHHMVLRFLFLAGKEKHTPIRCANVLLEPTPTAFALHV